MFQTFALMPWLTVQDNVELGLKARGVPRAERTKLALDAIDMIGLDGFESAYPKELSGGMRQRVGIARALVLRPDALFMDEPFSALDYQTRLAVSGDIWRIIRSEGKTALLVTHDISEAVSMSDRVVVLSRRPATVKAVFDMGELRRMDPLKRQENPAFARYFDAIWKDLELRE